MFFGDAALGPARRTAQVGLFAIGYLVLQKVGLAFTGTSSGIAAIWPAAGFAVGVIASRPRRYWPELLLAVALVNLAGNLTVDRPAAMVALFPLANLVETALAAWLIGRTIPQQGLGAVVTWLHRNYLPAGLGAPAVGASVASLAILADGTSPAELLAAWWSWFAADAIGIVSVAPLAIILLDPRARVREAWVAPRAESAALVGVQVAVTAALMQLPATDAARSTTMLALLPVVIWTSVRTGPRTAALTGALVTLMVAWATAHRAGPFVSADTGLFGAWPMQLFCLSLTTTALVIARTAQEIARSQQQTRSQATAMAHAMEGVAYFDTDQRYLRVNRSYADVMRLQPEDLIGRHWVTTVHPDDRDLARQGLSALMTDGLARLEFRRLRSDGSLFHSESVLVADRDPDGTLQGHYCFMRDVTSTRRATRQATRFFDLSAQLMLVTDADGIVQRINAAGATLLGWSPAERVGRPLSELTHPEDDHLLRAEALLPDGAEVPRRCTVRLRTRSGQYRTMLIDTVFDADDGLFYAAASDVTDLQERAESLARARDEALAASQLKSRFLATMSHEIRTPMNGVLGMSELLSTSELDHAQRQQVDGIQSAARALLSVINDVLDFSKIEAGHLTLDPRDFAPAGVIDNVLRIVRPAADGKGLRLSLDLDPNLRPCLHGDPGRLQQVLVNLAGNAIKFTDCGEVRVTVRDTARSGGSGSGDGRHDVVLTVQDTGVGMTAAELAHVFEPFVQAGSATRAAAGTGLGLAISRQIVTVMGGELTAGSEPGAGSVFTVRIPFATGASCDLPHLAGIAADPQLSADEGFRGRIAGSRVLLVEDIELNQRVAVGMLSRLGWQVDIAEDGEEAVQMATGRPYAAILMDCQMPRMDGYTATRILRALPATRQTPIIAMTANAYPEDRTRCLDSGMDAFLTKPIGQSSLTAVLGVCHPDPADDAAARPDTGAQDQPRRTAVALATPDSAVRARVDELVDGADAEEVELVQQILHSYLTALPRRLADVTEALQRGDTDGLAFAAHALKGASLNVGAVRSGAICARMEDLARVGDLAEAETYRARLADAAERDAEEVRTVADAL